MRDKFVFLPSKDVPTSHEVLLKKVLSILTADKAAHKKAESDALGKLAPKLAAKGDKHPLLRYGRVPSLAGADWPTVKLKVQSGPRHGDRDPRDDLGRREQPHRQSSGCQGGSTRRRRHRSPNSARTGDARFTDQLQPGAAPKVYVLALHLRGSRSYPLEQDPTHTKSHFRLAAEPETHVCRSVARGPNHADIINTPLVPPRAALGRGREGDHGVGSPRAATSTPVTTWASAADPQPHARLAEALDLDRRCAARSPTRPAVHESVRTASSSWRRSIWRRSSTSTRPSDRQPARPAGHDRSLRAEPASPARDPPASSCPARHPAHARAAHRSRSPRRRPVPLIARASSVSDERLPRSRTAAERALPWNAQPPAAREMASPTLNYKGANSMYWLLS